MCELYSKYGEEEKMNSKLQFFVVSLLACILVVTFISNSVHSLEIWIIYVPSSDEVGLKFWMLNQTGYINVTLYFGPCMNISSWGTVEKENSSLNVNTEIWKWTGWCVHWIPPPILHTYDLGYLEKGLYTFSFKVWNIEVKRIPFAVGFILVSDEACTCAGLRPWNPGIRRQPLRLHRQQTSCRASV